MEPNAMMTLIQTVGLPVALLMVVGYVFIKMTTKQAEELTHTHEWVRETMLGVQKDTVLALQDLRGAIERLNPTHCPPWRGNERRSTKREVSHGV